MVKRKSNEASEEKLKGLKKDCKKDGSTEYRETVLRNNREYEVVRCLACGTTDENYNENEDDGGDMIECETCLTWQHIDCMRLEDDEICNSYHCEICNTEISKYREVKHKLEPSDYFIDLIRNTRADFANYMIRIATFHSGLKSLNDDFDSDTDNFPKLRSKVVQSLRKIYAKHMIDETNGTELAIQSKNTNVTQENFAADTEKSLFESLKSINGTDKTVEYLKRYDFLKALLTVRNNDKLRKNLFFGKLKLKDIPIFDDDFLSNPADKKNGRLTNLSLVNSIDIANFKDKDYSKWLVNRFSGNVSDSQYMSVRQDINQHDLSGSINISPKNDNSSEVRDDTVVQEANNILIWRGVLEFFELSELPVEVRYSGNEVDLAYSVMEGEGPMIIEGRLDSKKAESYLNKVKSEYKVLAVEVFSPEIEKFDEYYKYLLQKSKYGVIKSEKNYIKDIYLVPREPLELEERSAPFLREDFINSKRLSLAFVINKSFKPDLKSSNNAKANISSNFLSEILDDQETARYVEKIFEEFPELRYNLYKLHRIVEEKYQKLKLN